MRGAASARCPPHATVSPVLRALAPDLWVAEAPLRWLGIELGRRMTVVRLSSGDLLVHSPAELTPGLKAELAAVGDVRFVVPASRFHGHLYMEQYVEAYPKVELFAAPGLNADEEISSSMGASPKVPIRAGPTTSTTRSFPAAGS